MKKSIVIITVWALPFVLFAQSNNFPANGDATINDGNLIQTGNHNISTQGAFKLKNYVLLDADGDFTGDNYYSIQDHPSGDYLRLGRGFDSNLIIDANGRVGVGTTAPTASFDVNENLALLRGAEKLYWGSKHMGSTDHRSYLAPRFSDDSGWDWNQEFGYHVYHRAWYFEGDVGIGTVNPSHKLDVNGNIRANRMIKIDGHGAVASLQIMDNSDTNTPDIVLRGDGGNSYIQNGNVGIGTLNPDSKLAVNGNIRAKEVKVETANWPDYVFSDGYDLPSLEEIQKHIDEKGHLPNIPSAKEVEANGMDLGEMNRLLLEKIEELTLYIMEQGRKVIEQERRLERIEILLEKNKKK